MRGPAYNSAIDIVRGIRKPKVRHDRTPQRPPLPDVAAVFEHEIGIRPNANEREDVEEYCISEGWVKVPAGKTVDRKGHPMLIQAQRQGVGLLPVRMAPDRESDLNVSFRRIQWPLAAAPKVGNGSGFAR